MMVSFDRVNWVTPLSQYYKGKSIFALNSDVITNTSITKEIAQSHDRKVNDKQYVQSRVLNFSGIILAKSINECRKQERELRSLITGQPFYIYDEDSEILDGNNQPIPNTGKVVYAELPNVNNSIQRGKYDGRAATISFNVNTISPFFEELERTIESFTMTGQTELVIDNSIVDDFAYQTPYQIKITFSADTVVKDIFDGLTLNNAISIKIGDVIIISSENQDFKATLNDESILQNVNDSYFIQRDLLQKGENTFIIGDIKLNCVLEFSFYKRTL